jgi:hypothetical protein
LTAHTPPPFASQFDEIIGPLGFDWRKFRPLAIAEARRFYRRLDHGQFKYEDLLSVALAALAASPGHKWARKAIRGALADFVREDLTVVKPVEMDEERYLSTIAELDDCLPTAGAVKPKPCDIPSDNPLVEGWRKLHGVTVGPGPRRIRRRVRHPFTGEWLELLPSRLAMPSGYKVTSKHGKVPVSIARSSYDEDGWRQERAGRVGAKPDAEDEVDPRANKPPVRGEVDQCGYVERGKAKRFSFTCYNDGEDHAHGLGSDWTVYRKGAKFAWFSTSPGGSALATATAWLRRHGDEPSIFTDDWSLRDNGWIRATETSFQAAS